jgi:hypothetical protein
VAGSCEHSSEPSGSVKGGVFLDKLSDYLLLKDSATCFFFFQLASTVLMDLGLP